MPAKSTDRDEVRSPEYIHGMFTAIVSGPLLLPSAWLPELMRASQHETLEDVQRAGAEVMNAYNAVARQVHEAPEAFITQTTRMLDADGDGSALANWARGYVHGMALAGEEWKRVFPDPGMRQLFRPIAVVMEMNATSAKSAWFADKDFRGTLAQACPMAAVEIAAFWRRRLTGNVVPIRRR